MEKTEHRRDIDGLRAIAVLAVLAFHLGIGGVPGGLVGVDVFYVISGFLITGMMAKDRVSFRGFYLRRLARLLPALAATVLLTLLAGVVFLDPGALENLGRSALHAMTAGSNIHFWKTLGYFDDAARTEPLLHTWSLSVEWQFYIVWPGLVYLAWKFGGRAALTGLVTFVLIGGFALEQWSMVHDPNGAFYLSPNRAFEFAAGGAVYLLLPLLASQSAAVRNVLTAIGAALIAVAIALMTDQTPFPGLWVLLPVAGAALLIGPPKTVLASVLSVRPLVLVGIWSYSLYLVHWPIITIARYVLYRPLTALDQITLLALTFAAGIVLHYIIEKPLRIFGRPNISVLAMKLAGTGLILAVASWGAYSVIVQHGFPSRIKSGYEPVFFGHMPCGVEGDRSSLDAIVCAFGEPRKGKILLVGDSHSRQFAYGLSRSHFAKDYQFVSVFAGSCVPFKRFEYLRNGVPDQNCEDAKAESFKQMTGDYDLVIFTAEWISRGITVEDLTELSERSQAPVLVLGPIPSAEDQPPCDRPSFFQFANCEALNLSPSDTAMDNSARAMTLQAGLSYISLMDVGCPKGQCPFYIAKRAVFTDRSHLSEVGSEYYISRASSLIEAALH